LGLEALQQDRGWQEKLIEELETAAQVGLGTTSQNPRTLLR
jgi:hypothetical protein